MRRLTFAIFSLLILTATFASAVETVVPSENSALPSKFVFYAKSIKLAGPGLIVIDPSTSTTLFDEASEVPRAPASVFKLVSTFAALKYVGPDFQFKTKIFTTSSKNTYLLDGNLDPWLTSDIKLAKKNGQRYLPNLISKANKVNAKSITIEHTGVFTRDLENLSKYLKARHIFVKFRELTPDIAGTHAKTEIATLTSLPVSEMVKFAILWSDNQLADRLGRAAARVKSGTSDQIGIQSTFTAALTAYGINTVGLNVIDGSGLSRENKVSARTIAEVLIQIRNDPLFSPIYEGLPVAGKSGTLKKRFLTTAPNAVGLVHAKTGFINTTVSLAGYVTVGSKEYVFAVIADKLEPKWVARNRARETIDSMLGTIAQPPTP